MLEFFRPFRGSASFNNPFPKAHAVGYILPPLPGLGAAVDLCACAA